MARVIDTFITEYGFRVDSASMRKAERAIGQVKDRINQIGNVALGVGAALTALGGNAAKAFIAFEDQLNKVHSLVGVSREQVRAWHPEVLRIAQETGQSATATAEALFFITSAGLRGERAINALQASAMGAASGLGEMKVIADLATSAMNAYGPATLSAMSAVDTLTAAVRLGKLEPEALAGAMGQVLPVASNLGVSFDEVAGAMAGMSKTGTDARVASTQLKAILTGILKPTADTERSMNRLGLSSAGLQETLADPKEGLWTALTQIKDAVGDSKAEMAAIFPNVRSLSGVFDLLGASLEDNKTLFADIADSTDEANNAFAAAQTNAFFVQQFKSSVESAKITLGKSMVETWIPFIQRMTELLNRFSEGGTRLHRFVSIVLTSGPAILAFGLTLKALAFALGGVATAIRGVAIALITKHLSLIHISEPTRPY